MKEWEKDFPLGTAKALSGTKTNDAALKVGEKEDCKVLTPISRIRSIARHYSKKYKVPIKVDNEAFESQSSSDGILRYDYDSKGSVKGTIYLHPVLKYYPEKYVKGVIEHEIDHLKVERSWEKRL